MSKYLSIDKSFEFEKSKVLGIVSENVRDAAYESLQVFLKEYVIEKSTPYDDKRINKTYGTKMELSTNAKVDIYPIEYSSGSAVSYQAFVHFGSDPVSKEYAIIQHENLKYIHPFGHSKFLERNFDELIIDQTMLIDDIAKKLSEVL